MQVKINGKDYPLRVTLGAQLLFKQDTGKEVSEMNGVEDFGKYLFFCTRSAAIADGLQLEATFEEFLHAFDQELLDQWEEMQAEYVEKKTNLRAARIERKVRESPIQQQPE